MESDHQGIDSMEDEVRDEEICRTNSDSEINTEVNKNKPIELVPPTENMSEGDQEIDQELQQFAKKVEDVDDDFTRLKNDLMDTYTDPPLNSGDCAVATEIVKFGEETPSHSKSDVVIGRKIKRVFTVTRPFLPRKSKTRAYESLRRIARGIVVTSIPIRSSRPKRLSRKPIGRGRKRVEFARSRASRNGRKRARPIYNRKTVNRLVNQESGTSVSSILSTTCSTCKSDDSL